jgi:hypothetical protein
LRIKLAGDSATAPSVEAVIAASASKFTELSLEKLDEDENT